jgi:hypothetical protein
MWIDAEGEWHEACQTHISRALQCRSGFGASSVTTCQGLNGEGCPAWFQRGDEHAQLFNAIDGQLDAAHQPHRPGSFQYSANPQTVAFPRPLHDYAYVVLPTLNRSAVFRNK